MNSINDSLKPNVFSFFLVEDDINPINISKVFNEIFGSNSNYELENARSVFSAVVKLNYCLEKNVDFDLYIFDIRLVEKEDKNDFPLGFPDSDFNKKLENFYGAVDGFSSYSAYRNLEINAYEEFKESSGFELDTKQEGLYLWSYYKNRYPNKFHSVIYSASPTAARKARWMDKKAQLKVLQKSLFDDTMVGDTFDIFLKEIERLSKGNAIKIFRGYREIQSYDRFKDIPEYEEDFVDTDGNIIRFRNQDRRFKNKENHLEVFLNEKKEKSRPQYDYTDLLKILELCSESIVYDPDEHILWDSVTDVDIDDFTSGAEISAFLEKKLGICKNRYWTLRTLFPAQTYRILDERKGDLDAQKKELRDLIAKYGWNDYAETLSMFFNQGAVYYRVHSSDEYFRTPGEYPEIFSSADIPNPLDKTKKIADEDTFKQAWKHQYGQLIAKIWNIGHLNFYHNTGQKQNESKRDSRTWQEIAAAFEDYRNPGLGLTRTDYLEYTAHHLFDKKNGNYFIKGAEIPVDFRGLNLDAVKLFFPGTWFLEFIKDIKEDHNNKKRGNVKQCDIRLNYVGNTGIFITSFILTVKDWQKVATPQKDKPLNFSITRKFHDTPLLKNFIRFNLVLDNSDGKRQIFNINNDFPMDPKVRKLEIKGQTILNIDREYTGKDADEIYVFSVTSSEPGR